MEVTSFKDIIDNYTIELSKKLSAGIEFSIVGIGAHGFMEAERPKSSYIMGMNVTVAWGEAGKRSRLGGFRLDQLPGCCGVLVSNGAFSNLPGRGVGSILARMRLDIAKHFGYTTLLCTDVTDNTAQRRILSKLGWKDVFTFRNSRTDNQVAISIHALHDAAEADFTCRDIEAPRYRS